MNMVERECLCGEMQHLLGICPSVILLYHDVDGFPFSETLPHWFQEWLYKFAVPVAIDDCSPYSTILPAWVFSCSIILAILTGIRWNLKIDLVCISMIAKYVEHFFKCFSFEYSLFKSVPHFFNWLIYFLIFTDMISLYNFGF